MNYLFENTLDEIASKIKNTTSICDLMNFICYSNDNIVFLDYRYFKYIATKASYEYIISHVLNIIDNVLIQHGNFNACICIKSLTIGDIEKHLNFIKEISESRTKLPKY